MQRHLTKYQDQTAEEKKKFYTADNLALSTKMIRRVTRINAVRIIPTFHDTSNTYIKLIKNPIYNQKMQIPAKQQANPTSRGNYQDDPCRISSRLETSVSNLHAKKHTPNRLVINRKHTQNWLPKPWRIFWFIKSQNIVCPNT
jgi:hypothetical protein